MAVDLNFLKARPKRRMGWEEDAEGRVVVLRPKLGSGRLGRWIASHFGNPWYRIRLDEIGTLVWNLCDGDTSLSEIIQQMRQHFGNQIEPAEKRLYQFIRQLHRSRLITL